MPLATWKEVNQMRDLVEQMHVEKHAPPVATALTLTIVSPFRVGYSEGTCRNPCRNSAFFSYLSISSSITAGLRKSFESDIMCVNEISSCF